MVRYFLILFLSLLFFSACSQKANQSPYVIVLGIAQDGGVPHASCSKSCCINRWDKPEKKVMVTSLGIVDPNSNETWMIDATPDFPKQLEMLTGNNLEKLKGIFLTHAHIGHYTGLMHLGREVMGAQSVPVYAMPKMTKFLSSNGPWSQLVDIDNIEIKKLKKKKRFFFSTR